MSMWQKSWFISEHLITSLYHFRTSLRVIFKLEFISSSNKQTKFLICLRCELSRRNSTMYCATEKSANNELHQTNLKTCTKNFFFFKKKRHFLKHSREFTWKTQVILNEKLRWKYLRISCKFTRFLMWLSPRILRSFSVNFDHPQPPLPECLR